MKMKKILSIILIITTMFGFALVPSTVQAKTIAYLMKLTLMDSFSSRSFFVRRIDKIKLK